MNEMVWLLEQSTTIFQKILLVWGKASFDNVSNRKKNPLLKFLKNKIQYESATLKIIIFDHYEVEKHLPATTLQMYGGDPILLINMEKVHYQTVMEAILKHPRKYILSLNLPFWTHQCTLLNKDNIDCLSGYLPKTKAFDLLHRLTELNNVCFCCFEQIQEVLCEQFCGHNHCAKCEFGKLCYHPEHKTEPDHIKTFFI